MRFIGLSILGVVWFWACGALKATQTQTYIRLQADVAPFLHQLAANTNDSLFKEALQQARHTQYQERKGNLAALFVQAYERLDSKRPLALFFVGGVEGLDMNSSNAQVQTKLNEKLLAALQHSQKIVAARVSGMSMTQPSVQIDPENYKIIVGVNENELPKLRLDALTTNAKLEFWYALPDNEALRFTQKLNDSLSMQMDSSSFVYGALWDLFQPLTSGSSQAGICALRDTPKVNRLLQMPIAIRVLHNARLVWAANTFVSEQEPFDTLLYAYIIDTKGKKEAPVRGEHITEAFVGRNPSLGSYTVMLKMNSEGARAWKKMTEQSIGRAVAIMVDNKVYSAPIVQNVISEGNTEISGNFTATEAEDLAMLLSSGELVLPLRVE